MIDVKELRIGSHVSVGGVRKRIDHIGINGELGEIYIFNPEWTKERQSKERSEHTWFCTQIEPIPLTAELLEEIGFELTGDWGEYKVYTKKNITVRIVGERIYAKVAPNLGALIDIKYLHELESFVYMTLGKELIEE